MDASGVGDRLFAAEVLTVRDDEVTTTASFDADVEATLAELASGSGEGIEAAVEDLVDRAPLVDPLVDLGREDPRTVAELSALADRLSTASDDDLVGVLPTLRLFRPTDEPTDGVPDPFVPVPAPHLPALSRLYSHSLVYVWLEDCTPCETVREDLEAIFAEEEPVMPLAVFGPEHSEFLYEEYSVNGGPALLFMRDGRVDSRLYGAQPRATVEAELSTLQR